MPPPRKSPPFPRRAVKAPVPSFWRRFCNPAHGHERGPGRWIRLFPKKSNGTPFKGPFRKVATTPAPVRGFVPHCGAEKSFPRRSGKRKLAVRGPGRQLVRWVGEVKSTNIRNSTPCANVPKPHSWVGFPRNESSGFRRKSLGVLNCPPRLICPIASKPIPAPSNQAHPAAAPKNPRGARRVALAASRSKSLKFPKSQGWGPWWLGFEKQSNGPAWRFAPRQVGSPPSRLSPIPAPEKPGPGFRSLSGRGGLPPPRPGNEVFPVNAGKRAGEENDVHRPAKPVWQGKPPVLFWRFGRRSSRVLPAAKGSRPPQPRSGGPPGCVNRTAIARNSPTTASDGNRGWEQATQIFCPPPPPPPPRAKDQALEN